MAAVLLAAGEPGKRYALPHSRIMIHQGSGGFRGNTPDVFIQVKEMETLVNANHELLARHTGQPIEKIIKDTERDYFMSPTGGQAYTASSTLSTRCGANSRSRRRHDHVVSGGARQAPRAATTERPGSRKRGDPGDHPAGSSRDDHARQDAQGPVSLLLLRQEPGAGPQAHRGPGRLHLRRVHQPVPGDHRGGAPRGSPARSRPPSQAPRAAPDQGRRSTST